MPTLRVLYVDNSFTFGGAINALAHLVSALDPERVQPVILSAQDQDVLEEAFEGTEVHNWAVGLPWAHDSLHRRVITLPGFRGGPLRSAWNTARAAAWLAFHDVPQAVRLARFMRRRGIDLVHLNTGVNSMSVPIYAARMVELPVVAHLRAHFSVTTRLSHRLHTAWTDEWITVSDSVRESVTSAGVRPARLRTIHDAVDLATFQPGLPPPGLRESLAVPENAPIFGIFGRLIPWKGIREFLLGAHRVIRAMPRAHALVVGDRSDGSEEYPRELERLVRELGIESNVRFTGFRKDVADMMRLCDVVVHTSIIPEPFGMTVIEAMATATPVVAADSGGPREIVRNGEGGLLVDPRDSEALSGAILRLLQNPDEARSMGRKGAARARQHFSAERYARDVQAVYEEVMTSRGS